MLNELLGIGVMASLAVGYIAYCWPRIGSASMVRHEQARLGIQFGGMILVVCLMALTVLFWKGHA